MQNRNSSNGIIKLILSLFLLLAMSGFAAAGSINVTITGARNEQGLVRCGLFASPGAFSAAMASGTSGNQFREAAGKIQGGRAVCAFSSVPAGTYAVAVFHAERGEAQITRGLFGKPTQGVGFSRNPGMSFGPPKFEAAAFPVGNPPVELTVKLSY